MAHEVESWGTTTTRDFIHLFLGDKLGSGSARDVYKHALDPTKVIKVETGARSFQNVQEFETWEEIKWTKWKKYFAPCHYISPCGIVLIQERTQPVPKEKLPKSLPNFFTDIKQANFGLLNGKVVCQDYAITLFMSYGLDKARDRKIKLSDWRIPEEN